MNEDNPTGTEDPDEAVLLSALQELDGTTAQASAGEGTPASTEIATGSPTPAPASTGQPAKGEAPPSRIEAAVRNARAEARAEVEKQYEPFKGLNPEDVTAAMALVRELRTPEGQRAVLQELADRMGVSLAASSTATPEKPEAPPTFTFPQPDVVSRDGGMKVFSADLVMKTLQDYGQHLRSQILGEMKPVQEFVSKETAQREAEQREAEARAEHARVVQSVVDHIKQQPHYDEAKVLAELRAMDPQERKSLGPALAVSKAYTAHLSKNVFPTISTDAERRVRDSLVKKAAGSGFSPGTTGQGGAAPRLETEEDLARHMEFLESTL